MERRRYQALSGVLALLLSLLCTNRVQGQTENNVFNVDTREPIVVLSPAGQNVADFFGFAIALHQMEDVVDGDGPMDAAGKTRLLVGAPKGTFPGGLTLNDTGDQALPSTGLLYSCSLLPGADPPCDGVRGDEDEYLVGDKIDNDGLNGAGRLFDHRPNAMLPTETTPSGVQAEQKIGQLLGATVYSNGVNVVTCAPAWTSTGSYDTALTPGDDNNRLGPTNALPRGRCYWTDRNLTNVRFLDPCNSGTDTNPIDVRGDIGQGYCTAGTGVSVLPLTEPRFVIGTPGYDRGKGTVFYGSDEFEVEDRTTSDTIGIGNIEHPNITGSLVEIRETSQGFQVQTGYITRSRQQDSTPPNILATAHRYDNSVYNGRIDVYAVNDIKTLLPITAEGTQIGEFFGYSMATVDLNDDHYDDLVVGAPMYSKIDSNTLQVEIGRVYIFINTRGGLSSEPLILEGSGVAGARFGMSVLNLGDIDQDGFEDIAVGAPYERDGDSTGVVYVYYGTSNNNAFQQQSPGVVSGRSIAGSLQGVDSLHTFGFSLAKQDVDSNMYNDLAIGAFDSGAVVFLRSLPVADVNVTLSPPSDPVTRSNRDCMVSGTPYACFPVEVSVTYAGEGLSGLQDVSVELSEIQFGNQRIFFGEDTSKTQQTVTLQPPTPFTPDMKVVMVYLLNNIRDSSVPLQLMAAVLQNELTTLSSGNTITDLDPDFRIRLPSPAVAEVMLSNNCAMDTCVTDFSLSQEGVAYLPSGMDFQSIEVGGVKEVEVQLTLANIGPEDAIDLTLNVGNSVENVFAEQFRVIYSGELLGVIDTCTSICPIRDLLVGGTMDVTIRLAVQSDAPVGSVTTTFDLTSVNTQDTDSANNRDTAELTVERAADLVVSVSFPQNEFTYSSEALENPPVKRSDVGVSVAMEVRVENVRSTTVNSAELKIYYPASSSETGEFFYLLPDCALATTVGPIICDTTALSNASAVLCGETRRKRHTLSPAVKQRRRQARSTAPLNAALHRSKRLEMTSLDCSASPKSLEDCLLMECTITDLLGMRASQAKVTVVGYVDERFFFDKSDTFQLTASATVSFDAPAENTIDRMIEPDQASAIITLSPLDATSDKEDSTLTIIVIVVVVVGSILLVGTVAVILYFCGFFRRKKKLEEEKEPEEGGAAALGEKPPAGEATTL